MKKKRGADVSADMGGGFGRGTSGGFPWWPEKKASCLDREKGGGISSSGEMMQKEKGGTRN